MRPRRAGIKRRMMTMLLLTSGVSLVLACAAFFGYEFVAFRNAAKREIAMVGQVIAANTTAALAFRNVDDASEVLGALRAERHIVRACVYDRAGHPFAWYPPQDDVSLVPAAPETDGIRLVRSHVVAFMPISEGGSRRLGTLFIQSDLGAIRERIAGYALIVAIVLSLAFLAAFILASRLQRQISNPVLALTVAAQAFSERRDYSVRARKTSDDELGRLTDAFNEMLGAIEEQTRALRESEALFRGVAENMPQIVWTSDPQGQLDYLNQKWFEYAGTTLHDLPAGGWAPAVHAEDRERVVERWSESLRTNSAFHAELRILRAQDHAWRWHIGRAAPLLSETGATIRWIGTFTDIDDAKRAEEQVRSLNLDLEKRVHERTSALEAALKELESFSYSVSHDLRAPLRHVAGYVDMLRSALGDKLEEKPRRYLGTITEATHEMSRLIDDLLEFSRMARVELNRAEVSLDAILRDALGRFELQIRNRQVDLRIEPLPDVLGDASMLKNVFTNLLDNAFKYTRNASPARIEIGNVGSEADRVVLRVKDNGAGFDMRYAHKLFGVFQRLHRSEEYEGTGIGLATVKRIVSRHGGRVWAEGEVGKGASVYFTLQPVVGTKPIGGARE